MPWFKKKKAADAPRSGQADAITVGANVEAMKAAGDVEGLIAVLGSKSADVNARGDAIQALGELGDPRAVEPLIGTSETPHSLARFARIVGGVIWAAENEPWLPDMPATLISSGLAGELGIRTAKALAALGDPRALPAFTALLEDERLREAAESPRRPDVPGAEMIGALKTQAADLREIARKASAAEPQAAEPPAEPQPVPVGGAARAVDPGDVMSTLMDRQAACLNCGTTIRFEEGGMLAMDRGIRDQVVMCPSCHSIFEVELNLRELRLTADVTSRYGPSPSSA